MAVVHGVDNQSMIDYAEKLIGIAKPQVIAVPWRDIRPHGHAEAMATLKRLSESCTGRCRLHLLAAGSIKQWPFIFACGVDSIDSTSWAHKILDPKSLSWKAPHTTARLDCTCSLCSKRQNRLISGNPSHDLNVYQHNLAVMYDQVQLIARALADGSISEVARKVNPKMHKELRALLFRGERE
jgi:queuine/archaeosine tRNA-ribosyltransferase